MTVVTVFRHVPRPIVGMIGVVHDRRFESFEANLDWLETTGVLVERFDPNTAPDEVMARPGVAKLLSPGDVRPLPLVLVGDVVVSTGVFLSRAELAHAVGSGVRQLDKPAA